MKLGQGILFATCKPCPREHACGMRLRLIRVGVLVDEYRVLGLYQGTPAAAGEHWVHVGHGGDVPAKWLIRPVRTLLS